KCAADARATRAARARRTRMTATAAVRIVEQHCLAHGLRRSTRERTTELSRCACGTRTRAARLLRQAPRVAPAAICRVARPVEAAELDDSGVESRRAQLQPLRAGEGAVGL